MDAKATSTPFTPGHKLSVDVGSLLVNPAAYRHLFYSTGCLLRRTIAVSILQHPRSSHWDATLYILRYLKWTSSLGLFFSSSNSLQPFVFTDASWASCSDSRRSVTCFCIFLGFSLIFCKMKKQAMVSRSSVVVEYRSMGSAVCELLWLLYLLRAFQVSFRTPVSFLCDNQATIHITENSMFDERTKYHDIDCHLIREQFELGFILPLHISGCDQLADLITKFPSVSDFARLFVKLGLAPQAPS
ncbi:UNVERIFIED_CONTAM: putative mitochondrial protein [Sesamum indicum]